LVAVKVDVFTGEDQLMKWDAVGLFTVFLYSVRIKNSSTLDKLRYVISINDYLGIWEGAIN
jgi:hypothetical protein